MTAQRAAVLICADVARVSGVDLASLQAWFREAEREVVVRVVPGLCTGDGQLGSALVREGASRAVLGLCGDEHDERGLQIALRQAGIDPLTAGTVRVGRWCAGLRPEAATAKAKVLLAAALAAARASGGSTVANAKPYFPSRSSRRSFLRFPVPAYRAVPSVDRNRCAEAAGCSLCADACPFGALSVVDGGLELDKDRCKPCGRCVSACPREAFHFPGYTPEAVEARVRVLLDPEVSTLQPRGILFVCAGARRPAALAAGWLPLEVPCAAMAPVHWLLAPLLLDAAAVGVLPCEGGGSTGCEPAVLQRVEFCQALLRRAGMPADLVRGPPRRPTAGCGTSRDPPLRGRGDGVPGAAGSGGRGALALRGPRGHLRMGAPGLPGGSGGDRRGRLHGLRDVRAGVPVAGSRVRGGGRRGLGALRPGAVHRLRVVRLQMPGAGAGGHSCEPAPGAGSPAGGEEAAVSDILEAVRGVRRARGARSPAGSGAGPAGRGRRLSPAGAG